MAYILIIEDEAEIAGTIEYALSTEGFSVVHVLNGRDGLEKISGADLIILDAGLPDISGFDLCREIRKTSEIPIIFLTARDSEIDRIVGLELGADDYVTKPFSPRELAARVKAVLRRSAQEEDTEELPNGAISIGSLSICDQRKEVHFHEKPIALSPNEYRILFFLMGHSGRIFSREQIMNQVWEDPGFSTERTVDTHIKTLRAKLRLIDEETVIETHRGFGYSLRG
jgi:two-component system, OmpR family, catabolic regulation response regulator CreB